MIAVSEEMKNEDLKDPSGMDQEACGETASETPKMEEAEEKTKEKAPEKEGFFKKKKDPKVIRSWIDEQIKKTKITILLISGQTLTREYVSYELEKSIANGNTIIPILIDSKLNNFNRRKVKLINKKLHEKLSGKNTKMRYWYRDNGVVNITNWLDESLEEGEI